EHLPVLLGSVTPAGVTRAARIADGINPIAFSADGLRDLVSTFRDAVRENGRDPASQLVIVRANVPITRDPLGDDRPFLGGSPRQIAEDLATVEDLALDQVLFANTASGDVEE